MHELTLTIPTDWALPAICTTAAFALATACALWRGGRASGEAEARYDHLLHMEEQEACLHDAVTAAEKRLEDALHPRFRVLPTTLESTSATDTEEHAAGPPAPSPDESWLESRLLSREFAAGPLEPIAGHEFAPLRVRETVLTERVPRFPSPGSYYAAPMAGPLWGRFRALRGGRSLQSYHTSQTDAESGANPVSATNLPFGTPTPC